VRDVTFQSGAQTIEGYLLLPPGAGSHAAVVFVHGSGGDRRELLPEAERLAARGLVALTITEPSTSSPPLPAAGPVAELKQFRDVQVRDVVAVRRAVDLLQSLPQVDPRRIGYLGWSAGARTGTFVAASEPRVRALVLLSCGSAPLAAFVAAAPPRLRRAVRTIIGSVDPLRYIPHARPGSLLLEDGTRDDVVPHFALLNIARAAPRGTVVRWYDAAHPLNRAAYDGAFDWLIRKLSR
jgi:dienelactone hydrolase